MDSVVIAISLAVLALGAMAGVSMAVYVFITGLLGRQSPPRKQEPPKQRQTVSPVNTQSREQGQVKA